MSFEAFSGPGRPGGLPEGRWMPEWSLECQTGALDARMEPWIPEWTLGCQNGALEPGGQNLEKFGRPKSYRFLM